MRKGFGLYYLIWLILFLMFVVGIIITPDTWGVFYKYNNTFWVGYITIAITFLAQFICTTLAFKDKEREFFYNIPIIRISYAGLIVTMITGIICMVIPDFPWWMTILLCLLIILLYVISIAKAKTAANIVASIDDKIEAETSFVKELTVKAKLFSAQNKSKEAKKVYEAIKYSYPRSIKNVTQLEEQINAQFIEFTEDANETSAEELIKLIKERNEICKTYK